MEIKLKEKYLQVSNGKQKAKGDHQNNSRRKMRKLGEKHPNPGNVAGWARKSIKK